MRKKPSRQTHLRPVERIFGLLEGVHVLDVLLVLDDTWSSHVRARDHVRVHRSYNEAKVGDVPARNATKGQRLSIAVVDERALDAPVGNVSRAEVVGHTNPRD